MDANIYNEGIIIKNTLMRATPSGDARSFSARFTNTSMSPSCADRLSVAYSIRHVVSRRDTAALTEGALSLATGGAREGRAGGVRKGRVWVRELRLPIGLVGLRLLRHLGLGLGPIYS